MGKPLSRPDCLRQNPTCLGKGEEEDGYIEDCYVPQRSIYDTMRINEQIDQGSKLNQTSKSTMEKMEGSTISSNGTLGAASNVFESRAPESKKLDERIIFDALKLSSDVQKLAPVPSRRRPNAERKDNVNRRSWKSFMPPNFPEFAERMEASLSEVSEAGASNPSLQEKRESSSVLTESSGNLDHREPQLETVTLEHVTKSVGIPEVQDVKNLSGDGQDFKFQQHSESSSREFHPLESEAAAASGNTDVMQECRFSSATWPRAMKSLAKGGFSEKQHPLGETACTVEMPPLSPCLSEELLDPELHILITPSLREKTESELKFEEDERWIMMEAEEEWEEEKLSEKGKTLIMTDEKKNSLADISEEREQPSSATLAEDGADCSATVLGTLDHPDQISCSDDPQPAEDHLASIPKDVPSDCSCVLSGERTTIHEIENKTAQGLEDLVSDLEWIVGPGSAEQLSDTDSVQMFLELEKECLSEEEVMPVAELENQASSKGLAPFQDAENSLVIRSFPGAALEKEQNVDFFNARVKDCDTELDGAYFNALDSSQVPNTIEFITHPDTMRNTSTITKECEKVPFSPKTAGEFKFRHPAILESLGEFNIAKLPNSDHRTSLEEIVSNFVTSEPAKESGSLSQVDCSQIEENVERVFLHSFNYALIGTASEPQVEALSYDTHLLTDAIHLEGEQGTVNQENKSLASSRNTDPCKFSMEKVCDKVSEEREADYEATLWKDQAPSHFHRDIPEQNSLGLQRESSESEILSLHLLLGGLRCGRDQIESVNDIKPMQIVASSEGDEIEMKDSDSLLDFFQEDQVVNIVPVLEERVPVPQRPAPDAAEPTQEDNVAMPAPEPPAATALVPTIKEAAIAAAVPALEEDIPGTAADTLEAHASAASVITTEVGDPATVVPASEGTAAMVVSKADAPAAAVATIEEDVPAVTVSTPKGAAAPATTVPALKMTVPVALVSSPESPVSTLGVAITQEDVPAVAESSPEGIAAIAPLPTTEEADTTESPVTPAAAMPTLKSLAAPAIGVPTPDESDILATTVPAQDVGMPTPEAYTTVIAAVPGPEEPVTAATTIPALDEEETPEGPAAPDVTMTTPEEPAVLAVAVPAPDENNFPEGPASPDAALSPAQEHATPATAAPGPDEDNALQGPTAPDVALLPLEETAALALAVPAVEEVFPAAVSLVGGTGHTDSVPISEEGIPVQVETSPIGMWIKERLGSLACGNKEVTGTVLHGQVPLSATDGLSSNEVIVAHFVVGKSMRGKVRFANSFSGA
ncbi:microtubule-actin cross-linking factor 1, isoforms 6/7-like [Rhynchocyon petersi]